MKQVTDVQRNAIHFDVQLDFQHVTRQHTTYQQLLLATQTGITVLWEIFDWEKFNI